MAFQLKEVNFGGRRLRFNATRRTSAASSMVTVIVGRNGVGKSRLLSALTGAFFRAERRTLNESREEKELGPKEFLAHYRIGNYDASIDQHGRIFEENAVALTKTQDLLPRRIVSTSVSPFDKFPLDRSRWHEPDIRDESQLYRYLGMRNRGGHISSAAQLSRVLDSLVLATRKSYAEIHRLSGVFEFLGYAPRVRANFRLRGSRERLQAFATGSPVSAARANELLGAHTIAGQLPKRFLNKETLERLQRAALMVLQQSDSRTITIEIDFAHGDFMQGSLQVFSGLSLLRQLRVVGLENFYLFRGPSAFRIIDLSSGEQAIVLTLLGIASEISSDSLVCIDEPEISLHPEWQERYIDLLQDTFSRFQGCHFVLATHSPQIISRTSTRNCSVLLMDEGLTRPAKNFAGRSADFQLARVFHSPGLHNEFLAREALNVLTYMSNRRSLSASVKSKILTLQRARESIPSPNDPVAIMIDAISQRLTS